MRAVNLLPDQGKQQGPTLLTTTTVAIAGAIVLLTTSLFLAVSTVQSRGTVAEKQETLNALRQEVAKEQAASERSAAARSTDQARVTAFSEAAALRVAWDDLLDDVSRVLPGGTWLTSLTMQSGSATTQDPTATEGEVSTATEPAPTAFVVSGVALSQNVVAQIMQRLALVPTLSKVTLQQSTRTSVGESKAFQFTMSASVRAPEVPR